MKNQNVFSINRRIGDKPGIPVVKIGKYPLTQAKNDKARDSGNYYLGRR